MRRFVLQQSQLKRTFMLRIMCSISNRTCSMSLVNIFLRDWAAKFEEGSEVGDVEDRAVETSRTVKKSTNSYTSLVVLRMFSNM